MEGGKKSSSSLASDLFGAKDSSAAAPSSSGIFRSLFPPPSKVGEESFQHFETEKKINSKTQTWTSKSGFSGGEGQAEQAEKAEPFHYSSSIHYGGRDVYTRPENAENMKKEGGEDNLDRRSWWQGSVYY